MKPLLFREVKRKLEAAGIEAERECRQTRCVGQRLPDA
jgi:hypothetical protein